MLSRIFPKQADNNFHGHWLAIVLLGVVSLMKGIQGVVSVIDTHQVVTTADGIPIETYGAAGGDTVIALTALLGFMLLVIALLGFVTLIRWRALIPFMLLVQLVVQLGGRVLLELNPIVRSTDTSMGYAGHPIGFYVNLAILAMTVIGFLLSLTNRSKPSALAEGAR